jgi:tetratricopeptide (TPR) repeat protein
LAKHAKGDLIGSIADYTKAIELDAEDAHAYANRAATKMEQGDRKGAFADCEKAIEISPKDGWCSYMRGCLRYDTREWKDALVDYRQALEKGGLPDYAQIRITLVRGRQGDGAAAREDLKKYLKDRSAGKSGDLKAKIMSFLAGDLAEKDLLEVADTPARKCEVFYYVGSSALIAGDKAKASDYLKKSVESGQMAHYEYRSARADLEFLTTGK